MSAPNSLAARTPADTARGRLGFVVAFALCLTVFFGDALVGLGEKSYTSADFTQSHVLTSLGERHRPGNPTISDPVVEMQTWLRFARDEVHGGELPLWNPYNGCGQPLLANAQSAVLSPFSLPFYVSRFDVALLVSALLKVAVAGAAMALFLRRLGLGQLATTFGALAFAFSGEMIVLLAYPHSAVIATLPLGLFFLEGALAAVEHRRGRARVTLELGGFALALAAGLLAGHPEPFNCGLVLDAAWFVARSWQIARASGARGDAVRRCAKLALGVGGATLAAVALAAPQVLPFLEYYARCGLAGSRGYTPLPSLERTWPYLLFPTAVGMPIPDRALGLAAPAPSFELVNGAYVGGAVLLGALVALAFGSARRKAFAFVVLACAWLLLGIDALGLGRVYDTATLVGHFLPLTRAHPVWTISLCALAACGVDELVKLASPRRTLALGVAAFALVAVGAAWVRANTLFVEQAVGQGDALVGTVHTSVQRDARLVVAACAACACAVAWAAWTASRRARLVCGAVLVAASFVTTGGLLRDYNPTVENRFVFPETPAIATLRASVGDARVLVLGENGLPPETNTAYRLAVPAGFDGLHVRVQDELYLALFDAKGAWRDPRRASTRALELFGVESIVTAGDWVPIGTALGERQLQRRVDYAPIALPHDGALEQRFVCDRTRLSRVAVVVSTVAGSVANGADATLRLRELDSGLVVAERTLAAAELRADTFYPSDFRLHAIPFLSKGVHTLRFATLEFAPHEDSLGKSYVLSLATNTENANGAPFAWRTKQLSVASAELALVGARAEGTLLFDYAADPEFAPEGKVARLSLWKFTRGLGPYFSVAEALESPSEAATFAALKRDELDPYRAVILERETPAASDATTLEFPARLANAEPAVRANIVERTATRVKLAVERATPGWLVAAQTWYPGWVATVNGEERPLRRANFAFQAVAVPAGNSIVELEFRPRSFRVGLAVALATCVLGAFVVARALRAA
ncbi:MAG: YfhO family protein [Planctomycetes bacterium]|nr:YfhO family protein [Planctomycetota bacterium]